MVLNVHQKELVNVCFQVHQQRLLLDDLLLVFGLLFFARKGNSLILLVLDKIELVLKVIPAKQRHVPNN